MNAATILAIVQKLLPILTAIPAELPALATSAIALIDAVEKMPVLGALIPPTALKFLDEIKAALSLFQSHSVEVLKSMPLAAEALSKLDLSDLPAKS